MLVTVTINGDVDRSLPQPFITDIEGVLKKHKFRFLAKTEKKVTTLAEKKDPRELDRKIHGKHLTLEYGR